MFMECLQDQGKQVVLLLNKSDLVPAAAVSEWVAFFRRMYPSMHVLPISASQGDATARAVLMQLLDCEVRAELLACYKTAGI